MKKEAKPTNYLRLLGTGLKVVVVAEALGVIVTYVCWKKMNTSQDFRHKMHNYCPPILESYYFMGETMGNLPTRKLDYEAWGLSSDGK